MEEKIVELWGMIEEATIETEVRNENGEFRSDDHWAVVRTRNYVISVMWPALDRAVISIGKKGEEIATVVYDVFKYADAKKVKKLSDMSEVTGRVDIDSVIEEVKSVLGF